MADERLWVVGPGRIGLSLGALLADAGAVAALAYTGRSAEPPDHPLFRGAHPRATYSRTLAMPRPAATGVIIAVPDAEISGIATRLADLPVPRHLPVLHTSGALGAEALQPLADLGSGVGSLHPLAAVADPASGPGRLRGAWFAVEGSAGAARLADWIVAAAGGRTLRVPLGGKPLYHAAAAVASNYVVALLGFAERLAAGAGLDPAEARAALVELALGAVRNVQPAGPAAALTGPIARGDVGTIAAHLAELSAADRALYSVLAREALALAGSGLDPAVLDRLERMLGGDE